MALTRRPIAAGAQKTKIERAVAHYGFSRYVIVDAESLPLGYVHLKDILRAA